MRSARILVFTLALALTVGFVRMSASAPSLTKIVDFSTSLEGRTDNQRHNASLSASKIDGTKVQPGKTFSFNQTCGTWSRDAGYRRAPVSFNGILVDAWGGGVCQTSTTLYNAALLSGMKIVERHPHRFAPSYITPGRDAAVAFSGIDLRFVNTLSQEVIINAKVEGSLLKVSLWAQAKPRSIGLKTHLLRHQSPSIAQVSGKTNRIRNSGKSGFEVVTIRHLPTGSEVISTDSYPSMDRIMERKAD